MIGFFKLLGQLIRLFLFIGKIYVEKDKKKSEAKAEIGKDIINAFKETNKKTRASRVNAVNDSIRGL